MSLWLGVLRPRNFPGLQRQFFMLYETQTFTDIDPFQIDLCKKCIPSNQLDTLKLFELLRTFIGPNSPWNILLDPKEHLSITGSNHPNVVNGMKHLLVLVNQKNSSDIGFRNKNGFFNSIRLFSFLASRLLKIVMKDPNVLFYQLKSLHGGKKMEYSLIQFFFWKLKPEQVEKNYRFQISWRIFGAFDLRGKVSKKSLGTNEKNKHDHKKFLHLALRNIQRSVSNLGISIVIAKVLSN